MVHTLFFENCMKMLTKAKYCLRYDSITLISVLLQSFKVLPFIGPMFFRQVIPMPYKPTSSYSELINMNLP
jgi:hypothetical protein